MKKANLVAMVRKTAPQFLPVPLSRAKHQCGLASANLAHDEQLTGLIRSATDDLETDTGFVVCQGSFDWGPSRFPLTGRVPLVLPIRNVNSIESIDYVDTDGADQAIDPGDYLLDLSRVHPQVWLASKSMSWPEVDQDAPIPIVINLMAGWVSLHEVEEWATQAILGRVADLWNDQGIGADERLGRMYKSVRDRRTYPEPT